MLQNFFPLTVVQRSRMLLYMLSLLGLIGPITIIGGIAWGIFNTNASKSVTFLVALGGCALLGYAVLTLVSFLLVKRGSLEIQLNQGLGLKLNDVSIPIAFSDVRSIKVSRQVRRFLQPKYWGQYPGATYRIFISGSTQSFLLEWDSSWNAKDGQKAVLGEDVVQAFVDAGLPKEKVSLNQKNWFWVFGLLFLGGLIWFVFFF